MTAWLMLPSEKSTGHGRKGEGTPRKLATATQPQFPKKKKIADFKQASGFQINRRTLRKFTFN
jgi:hypothetical protein